MLKISFFNKFPAYLIVWKQNGNNSVDNEFFQLGSAMTVFASFQLRAAAEAVGEVDLEKKFAAASESLRRGIIFANSLYL